MTTNRLLSRIKRHAPLNRWHPGLYGLATATLFGLLLHATIIVWYFAGWYTLRFLIEGLSPTRFLYVATFTPAAIWLTVGAYRAGRRFWRHIPNALDTWFEARAAGRCPDDISELA